MIIEALKIDGPKNIFLVHWNPKNDRADDVVDVMKWLSTVPGYASLQVRGGQPAPTNPLPKITLFNADNPVLRSVVEKITNPLNEPGAMIPLTAEEMEVWVNSQQTDWTQI